MPRGVTHRRWRSGRAWLAALLACGVLQAAETDASGFRWQLPRGFSQPRVPADNVMTTAKVRLGARLFADPRLSVTGRHSCQSCHSPARAFTDGLARSRGATGAELPVNAPTLFNVAYSPSLGWKDAGVHTLEEQMRGPLFNRHPVELGLAGNEARVLSSLAADPALLPEFEAAFPGESEPLSLDNVIRAIAAFERTLLSGDSPFDRYVFAGQHQALDAAQKSGLQLFFSARAGCSACHSGINFNGPWVDAGHPDAEPAFANTGTGGRLRVPTLRNLASTGPYMHDGRFATLGEVLDHYDRLATEPAVDARLARPPLTTRERHDLLRFLEALDHAR